MLEREIRWLVDEKYGGIRTQEAEKDILRLEAGEPVAYVIGFIEFLGSTIDLSLKPLIPRPETEFWVSELIKELPKDRPIRCLDLFSGSGCVGVALLKHLPLCGVIFAEKDPGLIAQIEINIKNNSFENRAYKIVESDIFSGVSGKFSVIAANPPYVSLKKIDRVQESVLEYEPHLALFGPDDGIFYVSKVLETAPEFLESGGVLYLEFGEGQKEPLQKLVRRLPYREVFFFCDQCGVPRYLRAPI